MSVNGRLIHDDVLEETVRLLSAAEEGNVQIRVLGGMAIVLHVGELLHPALLWLYCTSKPSRGANPFGGGRQWCPWTVRRIRR